MRSSTSAGSASGVGWVYRPCVASTETNCPHASASSQSQNAGRASTPAVVAAKRQTDSWLAFGFGFGFGFGLGLGFGFGLGDAHDVLVAGLGVHDVHVLGLQRVDQPAQVVARTHCQSTRGVLR